MEEVYCREQPKVRANLSSTLSGSELASCLLLTEKIVTYRLDNEWLDSLTVEPLSNEIATRHFKGQGTLIAKANVAAQ